MHLSVLHVPSVRQKLGGKASGANNYFSQTQGKTLGQCLNSEDSLGKLLEIRVGHFQPKAMGDGGDSVEKKRLVAEAIRGKISDEKFAELKKYRSNRLVKAKVVFYLWKGSHKKTDYTRVVKDLDSLLEILFDALKPGPPRIGIVENDSYICDINASKETAETEDDEGFRLILDEHEDKEMLRTLQEHQSKSLQRIARRLAASMTSSQPISKPLDPVKGDRKTLS